MSVFAFLILCVAVSILAFLLIRLERQARCMHADIVVAQYRDHTKINQVLSEIATAMANGIKVHDRVSVVFHAYFVELLFTDDVAKKIVFMHDSIGHDDEIEILSDEDDEIGLSVTYDPHECLIVHPRSGLTQVVIPVEDEIDVFRDRLVSDGWTITSLDAEEEDDAVLPDTVEADGQRV